MELAREGIVGSALPHQQHLNADLVASWNQWGGGVRSSHLVVLNWSKFLVIFFLI